MNLFYLDNDLVKCAEYHCNKHIVKMPLEAAQLVSTAVQHYNLNFDKSLVYKSTHVNHPWSIWTRQTQGNFVLVCKYGIELCKEYTFRYNKRHACQDKLEYISSLKINDNITVLEMPQCMPEEFKHHDIISAYRNYYQFKKSSIKFSYKNRKEPEWLK